MIHVGEEKKRRGEKEEEENRKDEIGILRMACIQLFILQLTLTFIFLKLYNSLD